MLNRQTVVVADVSKDERIPYELYASTFVKAVAMAPIKVDDPVGAIGAYWSHTYEPSKWEIEVLEALASAAATAVDTMLRIAELKRTSDFALNARPMEMSGRYEADIARVTDIAAVPRILDVALRMTGMGFAAVARVTEDRWIACQVLDHAGFGLKPGGELPLKSTLCDEIRDHRQPVVFNDASTDPKYCDHHTPRIYGLRGYISVPIILAHGQFFGTLCAIDPNPAKVNNPEVLGAFTLFAELIAHHLDAADSLDRTRAALDGERNLSELREQFIAVLGHDLRNPIAAIDAGTSKLLKDGWTDRSPHILGLMKASLGRMSGLVDNILDLARARMGGGITVTKSKGDVAATLNQVVEEINIANPDREMVTSLDIPHAVSFDPDRFAQMVSNLVSNAITHGAEDEPIFIDSRIHAGQLEVRVSNGGRPIPSSDIDKLFMPFRRGGATTGMEGLGLGLFIASEIAKGHGGNISVSSDDTETAFTFRMPILWLYSLRERGGRDLLGGQDRT
jgi:signal transduction histidine kinase